MEINFEEYSKCLGESLESLPELINRFIEEFNKSDINLLLTLTKVSDLDITGAAYGINPLYEECNKIYHAFELFNELINDVINGTFTSLDEKSKLRIMDSIKLSDFFNSKSNFESSIECYKLMNKKFVIANGYKLIRLYYRKSNGNSDN